MNVRDLIFFHPSLNEEETGSLGEDALNESSGVSMMNRLSLELPDFVVQLSDEPEEKAAPAAIVSSQGLSNKIRLKFANGYDVPADYAIREQGQGRNKKYFTTIDGQEVQVYTVDSFFHRRLKFADGRNVPTGCSIRKQVQGRTNQYFAKINDEEVEVFTASALSHRRLKFEDGRDVPADCPTRKQGQGRSQRYFATIDGQEVEVFTALVFSRRRLKFADGRNVPADCPTRKQGQGRSQKYFATIDGQEVQVYTAKELSGMRSRQKKKIGQESGLASIRRSALPVGTDYSTPRDIEEEREQPVVDEFNFNPCDAANKKIQLINSLTSSGFVLRERDGILNLDLTGSNLGMFGTQGISQPQESGGDHHEQQFVSLPDVSAHSVVPASPSSTVGGQSVLGQWFPQQQLEPSSGLTVNSAEPTRSLMPGATASLPATTNLVPSYSVSSEISFFTLPRSTPQDSGRGTISQGLLFFNSEEEKQQGVENYSVFGRNVSR